MNLDPSGHLACSNLSFSSEDSAGTIFNWTIFGELSSPSSDSTTTRRNISSQVDDTRGENRKWEIFKHDKPEGKMHEVR